MCYKPTMVVNLAQEQTYSLTYMSSLHWSISLQAWNSHKLSTSCKQSIRERRVFCMHHGDACMKTMQRNGKIIDSSPIFSFYYPRESGALHGTVHTTSTSKSLVRPRWGSNPPACWLWSRLSTTVLSCQRFNGHNFQQSRYHLVSTVEVFKGQWPLLHYKAATKQFISRRKNNHQFNHVICLTDRHYAWYYLQTGLHRESCFSFQV